MKGKEGKKRRKNGEGKMIMRKGRKDGEAELERRDTRGKEEKIEKDC